jgi:hypothetical protein
MDFPVQWDFFPSEDFSTAVPRNPGELGVEVLAQARPNGRVLDHFRVTLGGSRILDINTSLARVINGQPAATWKLKFQTWPGDLEIRRNMTTSAWYDLHDLVAAKDGQLLDQDGKEVAHEEAMAALKEHAVAYRYAVIVGEDERLQLQLQAMPATAATLMGKPSFRG